MILAAYTCEMTSSQNSFNAPAAQQQLGWQARLRWAHGIAHGLADVAKKLDEFLTNQTGSSLSQKEMQELREAQMSFDAHQFAWLQACTSALQQAARKPPVAAATENKSATGPASLNFELLSDDAVENKILASRMAMAMGEAVQPGFDAMRLRIQMLDGQELAAQDMFRAETICLHLVEQWMACGMERAALLFLSDAMQNALAQLLASEYDILHKMLDAKGVSSAQDAPLRVRRMATGVPGRVRGAADGRSRSPGASRGRHRCPHDQE